MNTDAMTGLSSDRLRHLKETIEGDIAQGRYLGATIIVARHGEIGLHEALGTRRSDDTRSVEKDSVFSLFSLTKGLTNILILRAVELGRLRSLPRFQMSFRNFPASRAKTSVWNIC